MLTRFKTFALIACLAAGSVLFGANASAASSAAAQTAASKPAEKTLYAWDFVPADAVVITTFQFDKFLADAAMDAVNAVKPKNDVEKAVYSIMEEMKVNSEMLQNIQAVSWQTAKSAAVLSSGKFSETELVLRMPDIIRFYDPILKNAKQLELTPVQGKKGFTASVSVHNGDSDTSVKLLVEFMDNDTVLIRSSNTAPEWKVLTKADNPLVKQMKAKNNLFTVGVDLNKIKLNEKTADNLIEGMDRITSVIFRFSKLVEDSYTATAILKCKDEDSCKDLQRAINLTLTLALAAIDDDDEIEINEDGKIIKKESKNNLKFLEDIKSGIMKSDLYYQVEIPKSAIEGNIDRHLPKNSGKDASKNASVTVSATKK